MKIKKRPIKIILCFLSDENWGKAIWDRILLASWWKSRKDRLRSDFARFPMKIKERLIEVELCSLLDKNWGKADWGRASFFSMKIKGRPIEIGLFLLLDENRGKVDRGRTLLASRWKSREGRPRSGFFLPNENWEKAKQGQAFMRIFSIKIEGRSNKVELFYESFRWKSRKGQTRSGFSENLLDENRGKADWDQTFTTSQWKSRKGWLRSNFYCFSMRIEERLIEIRL